MRIILKKALCIFGVLSFAIVFSVYPAAAGDTLLSNNSGDGNAVFFIEGESSVVINGFDLTPLDLALPVALDSVSISVNTTVAGSSIQMLVYQDANGGSPVDATLVYQQSVMLEQIGINRIELNRAAIITEPVVWVGFNLPVGFKFYADTSGSSVLTYWAWTAGGTFALRSLSNAGVLGPGDGSEPVNISMDGIARITAELRTAQYEEIITGVPLGRQISPTVGQDTSIMRPYANCASLLFDPDDIIISADSSFTLNCAVESEFNAPAYLAQPRDQQLELLRLGTLYKLSAQIPPEQHVAGAVSTLPVPVTHCMRISAGDLERAVIGEVRARFQPAPEPEKWHILPSVRFNDLVCAEVTVANYIAYFLPETVDSPQNVNLVQGWTRVNPHPLYCDVATSIIVPIVNTGQDWFYTDDTHITILVQDIHVSSTIVTEERRIDIANSQLGPGARQAYEVGPLHVDAYINELHRLQVTIDQDNEVDEINESDNSWFTEYVLSFPPGREKCGPPPLTWKQGGCSFRFDERYEGDDEDLLDALDDLAKAIIKAPSGITDGSAAASQLRRSVSSERWAILEAWFFASSSKIIRAVAPAVIRQSADTSVCE